MPGLREWGSGEVRVEGVSARSAPTVSRGMRFVSGEPVMIRLSSSASAPVPPPVLSLEVRDASGSLLGANQQNLGELGWDGAPGTRELRFSARAAAARRGRVPAERRARPTPRARGSTTASTGRSASTCQASDHARGAVLLEGEWALADAEDKVEAA